MLYFSSLWGPLVRSMYTKKMEGKGFNLYWGRLENVLAIVCCNTRLGKKVFVLI